LKYSPIQYNPTDLLSRGIPLEELKSCTLWMRGPEWITNEKNWPSEFTTKNVLTTIGENEEDSEISSETKQIQNSILNIIEVNAHSGKSFVSLHMS
jgi:Ulp1 family protease